MSQDQVRVLRIIEYVGDRSCVEEHLKKVLYGYKDLTSAGRGKLVIKAVTLDQFPEVLDTAQPAAKETKE